MTHSPTPRYFSTQLLSSFDSVNVSGLKLGLCVSEVSFTEVVKCKVVVWKGVVQMGWIGGMDGHLREAGGALDAGEEGGEEDGVEGVVG